ncbi:MAG: acetoacetate decarboxylase family protein [Chloroflexota bacterium]|nr:acetoacetate decarboxylase family protein [Chloroflexota bacterium]MDE2908754.1 acetoacetate decarboxylase family protein [Chloroflexota bacterium]
MPYPLDPNKMYYMPTHFGPRAGPRQGPDGRKFECVDNPLGVAYSVSFLTNARQLEPFLPPGFALDGEPVVTVFSNHMTEIEWLAGRGYNVLGVSFPVSFTGERDRVRGSFLTVLWENLTDPILTGREEIGFSKIYCELPPPTQLRGDYHLIASWLGFKFLDIHLSDLRELSAEEIQARQANATSDGTLHYKYMPRTGEWGKADIAYPVLTPATNSNQRTLEQRVGSGSVQFHRARWEDLPTQYNIVNAFADLELLEYRGASLTKTIGGKDISDQRILR